ncbi:MAG TPA: energy-coupling factor transporter transmembrane protein EcfT [Mycobacteriales bacterium]|nr:energy-coupling factor transporter transmembrane protein EcfT [Mycobacteriales bacterium]
MSRPGWIAVPRQLHPGAWWLWAVGLGTAASRTTNPLLLALVAAVAGYVVAARRPDAPWARAYSAFVKIGLAVIAIRVVLQAVVGAELPGHELLRLPRADLPGWLAGIRVGGPVTAEELATAAYDGLRLAVLLACLGAANALANPSRLLKAVPGALYELGVAVVVAMSFAPQAVTAVGRVRAARKLRGRPDRGLRGLRGLLLPVLETALERSIALAASMDSRGYGRRAAVPARARRATAALTAAGLLGICAGTYGLLDSSATAGVTSGAATLLGLPVLVAGVLLAGLGLALGGRRVTRSRYRPDPWDVPEWLVAAAGVTVAAVFVVLGGDPALHPSTAPLVPPPLPLAFAAATLVGLLPAVVAPALPRLQLAAP